MCRAMLPIGASPHRALATARANNRGLTGQTIHWDHFKQTTFLADLLRPIRISLNRSGKLYINQMPKPTIPLFRFRLLVVHMNCATSHSLTPTPLLVTSRKESNIIQVSLPPELKHDEYSQPNSYQPHHGSLCGLPSTARPHRYILSWH